MSPSESTAKVEGRFRALAEEVLALDEEAEVLRISDWMTDMLRSCLHRRGFVVAVSGGIDSSVCAALAVRAVGKGRVLALLLPERDSSSESALRGRALTSQLGIEAIEVDIEPTLDTIGCYGWRDDAIRRVFPQYGPGWRSKIVIAGGTEGKINYFRLVAQPPDGESLEARLGVREYLQIVAATNFKQRVRKTLEYFHADRMNYAVVGTPNRLEYDLGFFVKNGDGSADIKPIAHLYKTQVYLLARHLGLPAEIQSASPTTDTYPLPQGQDEFYYGLPYPEMDLALWHHGRGSSPAELAEALGTTEERAQFIYTDIERKRSTTAPLHWVGLVLDSAVSWRAQEG